MGGEWVSFLEAFSYQMKLSGSKNFRKMANEVNMTITEFKIRRFSMLGMRQLLR